MTKLNNSKCDQTQIGTKLENSSSDETFLKLWQILNYDESQFRRRKTNLKESFSKNILTPWQPMLCSVGSVLRFSRCFGDNYGSFIFFASEIKIWKYEEKKYLNSLGKLIYISWVFTWFLSKGNIPTIQYSTVHWPLTVEKNSAVLACSYLFTYCTAMGFFR